MSAESLFKIVPTDRKMARAQYKRLRQMARRFDRMFRPEIEDATMNLLLYGQSGIVHDDRGVRVLTATELSMLERNQYLASPQSDNALIVTLDEPLTPNE